jgi:hypothetical protein
MWLGNVFATRLYQQTAGKVTSSRQRVGRRDALCKKADDLITEEADRLA